MLLALLLSTRDAVWSFVIVAIYIHELAHHESKRFPLIMICRDKVCTLNMKYAYSNTLHKTGYGKPFTLYNLLFVQQSEKVDEITPPYQGKESQLRLGKPDRRRQQKHKQPERLNRLIARGSDVN